MILLDTKVVSEPLRMRPDPAVVEWLDRQVADTLFFTATGLAELLVGVSLLPAGRRRDGLGIALSELLSELFSNRVLAFDSSAAVAYAELIGRARVAGHTLSVADGQIAAIAQTHGYAVATRDVAPFLAAGVVVINPWEA